MIKHFGYPYCIALKRPKTTMPSFKEMLILFFLNICSANLNRYAKFFPSY